MEAPLRAAEEALGAVFGQVADRPLPRHFGDSLAEYRAVREGVGVVDRADLAVVRLWGRDPVKMLQGLITNDLAGAPAGRGVYGTMLTPKGRVIAELRAFSRATASGPEVITLLPREALEGTRQHLTKFVPPLFARWADDSDALGVVGAYGPRSRELVERALGQPLPELEEDAFAEVALGTEPVVAIGTRYAGGEQGFDLLASTAALPALWDALLAQGADLGARPIGFGALETLRIEAGLPRYGHELSEAVIPTEAFESTGLMSRAISFTKGCYTGQEVIVRIAHRGHVNRHLRGLRLGDLPAPAPRTPLFHPESGKEIGWTASAAYSPLVGETVALALVRREVTPGEPVRLGSPGGETAEVASLPFQPRGNDADE